MPGGSPAGAPQGQALRRLHLWQIQALRDMAVIGGLVLLVLCGYWLRAVTVPLLIALALAYLFEPVVKHFTERRGYSRPMVVSGLIGLMGVIVILLGFALGLALLQTIDFVRALPEAADRVLKTLDENLPPEVSDTIMQVIDDALGTGEPTIGGPPPLIAAEGEKNLDEGAATDPNAANSAMAERDPEAEPQAAAERDDGVGAAEPSPATRPARPAHERVVALSDRLREWLAANVGNIFRATVQTTEDAVSLILRLIGSTIYLIFLFFLIPFYFFAFSTGWPKLREYVVYVFPPYRAPQQYELLRKMDHAVSAFVRGRIVISMIVGVLLALGWGLCGVPYWILVGMLSGLFFIVPYLGGIGWPIAIALLWLRQGDLPEAQRMAWWGILLWPTVVYVIVQLIETYLLTPVIAGKATNLGPVSIVVAVLAGGAVGGVYGMLLAIPAAACLKIVTLEVFVPRLRDWARGKAADPLPIRDT